MIKRESRPVHLGNPDKDGWSPIFDDKTGKILGYFNPVNPIFADNLI